MSVDTYQIQQEAELQKLSQDVVKNLQAGDVLLLSGDLGAGKTTFTQYLARTLGITDAITSPTFTIMGEYEVPNNPALSWLVHIDLYRIPEDRHGVDQGYISEVVDTAKEHKRVVVIEWPERLGVAMDSAWKIVFTHGEGTQERTIAITKPS